MPRVPCIIPFFRAPDKLARCLAAIEAQRYQPCVPFVRDNSEDNILYTAAVNEGLRHYCYDGETRYVVVLNQDAYMEPDCVDQLVAFMDDNLDCGIACPLQFQKVEEGGRWGGLAKPLTFRRERRTVTWGGSFQAWPLGAHRTDPIESYADPFETYWANGGCMMIRTEAVREAGLFDRNMRFICSDSDFSFTVRARGWKIFVVPQALAEHEAGASAGTTNPEIELVKVNDIDYFTRKWLSGDLYKSMAYEGPQIQPAQVTQLLEQVRASRELLELELGIDEDVAE